MGHKRKPHTGASAVIPVRNVVYKSKMKESQDPCDESTENSFSWFLPFQLFVRLLRWRHT